MGIDFAGKTPGAADGMKIPSIMGGTVKQVFVNNKTAGHGVVVQGADGREYRYIHMKYAPKLKVGQKVTTGQNLGFIGSTGRSTGPHLDLKVYENGKAVDPMKIIRGMKSNVPQGKYDSIYGKATTSSKASTGQGGSYSNTWKTQKEALKTPGYQAYKGHLSKAIQSGGVPTSWVVALTELVGRESSWNSGAKNPRSTAHGYGQFLKSTRANYEKKTGLSYSNPVHQLIMMAQYVKERYKTPEKALAFWDRNRWY